MTEADIRLFVTLIRFDEVWLISVNIKHLKFTVIQVRKLSFFLHTQ